jgi:hypothetical protein
MTPSELHNKLAGEIVASIVKPVVESGGGRGDVLVLTESVVLGVLLALQRLEQAPFSHNDAYLRALASGLRTRLEAQRSKERAP